jgi:hypothetical protein
MKTKVLFRMFRGEVLALFPTIAATAGNPYHCQSYAQQGQHAAADPRLVIDDSRPAFPEEYRNLARELRKRGYKLDIRQRSSYTDTNERRQQLAG